MKLRVAKKVLKQTGLDWDLWSRGNYNHTTYRLAKLRYAHWQKTCLRRIIESLRPLPPEFAQVLNEHFWELI